MIFVSGFDNYGVINSYEKKEYKNPQFNKIIRDSIRELKKFGEAYVFTLEQARAVESTTAAEIKVGNGYYKLIAREER